MIGGAPPLRSAGEDDKRLVRSSAGVFFAPTPTASREPPPSESTEEIRARSALESHADKLCMQRIRESAARPSTVSFPWFDPYFQIETLSVLSKLAHVRHTATARNSFNLEIRYRVDCVVVECRITSFNVREAR